MLVSEGSVGIVAGKSVYRADIDGLRALAIGMVVAFHAFSRKFSGGFVGVDIFFVISGYLISRIIFSQVEDGRYSVLGFYAKRIRRIFPALIVVLVASYVAGTAIMLTSEFRDLSKYIAAGTAFLANIVLLQNSGYFGGDAELNPMLHLWSLGVEEQFYIIWPVLIYWAHLCRADMRYVLGIGFLASFAINMYFVVIDTSAAFYLPYTRFFELLIGSTLAYYHYTLARQLDESAKISADIFSSRWHNIISFVGVLLIAGAEFLINKDRLFPGAWALLPTLGAACLIWAGPFAWVNRKILAHPLFVQIGLISYPLYLWHWPILAFMRLTYAGFPPTLWRCIAVAVSILLAWLTYQFVEKQIRFRKSGWVVPLLCIPVAVLGMVGLYLYLDHSWHLRGTADDMRQLEWVESENACYAALGVTDLAHQDTIFCHLADPKATKIVAIIGDSMANSLYPGMREVMAARGSGVENFGVGTCAPFRGLYGNFAWNRHCAQINERIYNVVASDPRVTTVVMGVASWDLVNMQFDKASTKLTIDQKMARMQKYIARDIAFWKSHGKKLVVTFDGPDIGISPRYCIYSNQRCTSVAVRNQDLLAFWNRQLSTRSDLCVFWQSQYLRSGEAYPLRHNGHLLYRDDHHLSFYGSRYIAENMFKSSCATWL